MTAPQGHTVSGVRWEDDGSPVTMEAMLAHPNRVLVIVDERGIVTDRFRPCNLGGPMLSRASDARRAARP